jgi:hypothetical protein
LADVFGLDPSLVEPIDTPSLKQAAARPLRAGLRMDRFKARFPSVPVLDARSGLERLAMQMARSLQAPEPVRAAE